MRNTTLMRPWTRRIVELLDDGAWHDRDELIEAAITVIPPGVAFRRGEADRARKRPLGPGERVRGDRATSIATGGRSIAYRILNNQVSKGTIERSPDGQRYRRTGEVHP